METADGPVASICRPPPAPPPVDVPRTGRTGARHHGLELDQGGTLDPRHHKRATTTAAHATTEHEIASSEKGCLGLADQRPNRETPADRRSAHNPRESYAGAKHRVSADPASTAIQRDRRCMCAGGRPALTDARADRTGRNGHADARPGSAG